MNADQELFDQIRQVTPAADDSARQALATWLAEHGEYHPKRVARHSWPSGLTTWFVQTVLPRHSLSQLSFKPPSGRWTQLCVYNTLIGLGCCFSASGGFSTIAGCGVITWCHPCSEHVNAICARLHATLGAPVTYSRVSGRKCDYYRFIVWYGLKGCTLPAPSDNTGPLTEQFVRSRIEAATDSTLPAWSVYHRYTDWMSERDAQPLSRPQFAQAVANLFPQATIIRRKTMTGIRWTVDGTSGCLNPCSTF